MKREKGRYVRIVSDGTGSGTRVYVVTEDGVEVEIPFVSEFVLKCDSRGFNQVEMKLLKVKIDAKGKTKPISTLARKPTHWVA